MTTTFIAVNATCQQLSGSQRSCAATAVRHALLNTKESSQTLLDTTGYNTGLNLFQNLMKATVINDTHDEGSNLPGAFGFLADPETPFNFKRNRPY
jgi:hypothetical protein